MTHGRDNPKSKKLRQCWGNKVPNIVDTPTVVKDNWRCYDYRWHQAGLDFRQKMNQVFKNIYRIIFA